MKRVHFLYSLLLLLLSCKSDTGIVIPENVLSKEEMTSLMVDIHLAEAAMNLGSNPQSFSPTSVSIDADILKKHHTTKQLFEESFTFYTEHPVLMNEIYQDVLNELSRMQAEVMKEN